MIVGKVVGKITTQKFMFKVIGEAKKFQYVQVMHKDYGYVLCQITEIEQAQEQIARCIIIGFRKDNKLQLPRSPFQQEAEILDAEDKFLEETLELKQKNAAYIGQLETRNLKVYLDLNKLLTKHIAIIAKTGAGKSYTAGILIEEILEKKVPLLIIDPHGEYSQLKYPNSEEKRDMDNEPKGYSEQIKEYGSQEVSKSLLPIQLNDNFSAQELLHILPAKITQSQKALIYSIIKDITPLTINNLIHHLSAEEDVSAVNLMAILDYIKSLKLFSSDFISYEELIRPGICSIINLKGIAPEIQELIVYKLLKDLFEQRKIGNIAPFFTVIEESHNFAPERSFGEAKSSSILRTIASEGRKFGLGLCVVTQRPARLDKNVLSQCSTHIILKVTNPLDLKAITSSVENVTSDSEEEIKALPVGTALVTGIIDIPLFVRIRQRKSKHGGVTVNILEESQDMLQELKNFGKKEILPLIFPKTSLKDIKLMEGKDKIFPMLIPAFVITAQHKNKKFKLLVESIKGQAVKNIDTKDTIPLIGIENFSQSQKGFWQSIVDLKKLSLLKISEKTNLPILKVKEFLDFFQKNALILKAEDNFTFSQTAGLLINPLEFQFLGNIEFRQINYKSKLMPRISEEEIRNKLKFLEILELKKCYIVYYKVE